LDAHGDGEGGGKEAVRSCLVDIVREYLDAYNSVSQIVADYRRDVLEFESVNDLIWHGEESVLFRLKERCHEQFRRDVEEAASLPVQREMLFDLAVGALFLETMKLREHLYQESIFGPKIQKLRRQEGIGDDPLFIEFEKILRNSAARIEESVDEIASLLQQTHREFYEVLLAHRDDGFVTRHLTENGSRVGAVFQEGLESLLGRIYGDAARGYLKAAWSYVASGCFREAQLAFERVASTPDVRSHALDSHLTYCRGMKAFLGGDLEDSVCHLEKWSEGGVVSMRADQSEELAARALRLACAAAKSVIHQAKAAGDHGLAGRAMGLAEKLSILQ